MTVEGNPLDIKRFREAAKHKQNKEDEDDWNGDTEFSIDNFLPMPKEFYKTSSPGGNYTCKIKYGSMNWYDWRCKNWGIKWDVQADAFDESETHISYTFDSPWAPPILALMKISKEWPGLTFSIDYEEPGMCFWGEYVIKGGIAVEEKDGKMEGGICPHCETEVEIKDAYRDCPECGKKIDKMKEVKEDGTAESNENAGKEGSSNPDKQKV